MSVIAEVDSDAAEEIWHLGDIVHFCFFVAVPFAVFSMSDISCFCFSPIRL